MPAFVILGKWAEGSVNGGLFWGVEEIGGERSRNARLRGGDILLKRNAPGREKKRRFLGRKWAKKQIHVKITIRSSPSAKTKKRLTKRNGIGAMTCYERTAGMDKDRLRKKQGICLEGYNEKSTDYLRNYSPKTGGLKKTIMKKGKRKDLRTITNSKWQMKGGGGPQADSRLGGKAWGGRNPALWENTILRLSRVQLCSWEGP